MFGSPSRAAATPPPAANDDNDAPSSSDEVPDDAQSLNVRPVRVAVVPPKFNGLRNQDPQFWVQNFNRCADSNGWTESIKLKQFPSYLTDKALLWYSARTQERERLNLPKWDWATLKEEFLNCNGNIKLRKAAAEYRLLGTRQKPNQSAYEFLIEMDNIMNFVDSNMSDETRIKWVKRGLLKDTLKVVNLHNATTMTELAHLLSKDDEISALLSSRNLPDEHEETFLSTLQGDIRQDRSDLQELRNKMTNLEVEQKGMSLFLANQNPPLPAMQSYFTEHQVKPNNSETDYSEILKRLNKLEVQSLMNRRKSPTRSFSPYANRGASPGPPPNSPQSYRRPIDANADYYQRGRYHPYSYSSPPREYQYPQDYRGMYQNRHEPPPYYGSADTQNNRRPFLHNTRTHTGRNDVPGENKGENARFSTNPQHFGAPISNCPNSPVPQRPSSLYIPPHKNTFRSQFNCQRCGETDHPTNSCTGPPLQPNVEFSKSQEPSNPQ
jgi:hypothetical protein